MGADLGRTTGAPVMSPREADGRPDTEAVLEGLKGFQLDTVEYAFERLYRAPDSTRRFLVADEVGLGNTLVARGVIAKALDHLWDGPHRVEQIDVVYICSNAQIARQNVRRLQIGNSKFVRADRLTLLPIAIRGLRGNRVNYFALTPGTSIDLKSSTGRRDERVLLYHLVQGLWPDKRAGPKNLFQCGVKDPRKWRRELKGLTKRQIDTELAEAFVRRLEEEGEGLRVQYSALRKRFWRFRARVPAEDRRERDELIGHLRELLAEVCVTALEPDLVILDEFQRFKNILHGQDATAELANRLFTYADETSAVRVVLLSATPYRMYTLHHERAEDDHYRDFLGTVEFLDPRLRESGTLRRLLDEYRQAMYRIESGTEALVRIKGAIEAQLRRVMSRTERLRASTDAQGMMRQVPSAGLQLTADDVGDFLALEKIGREVRQPQVLEYWKSAPYLLSFMDDYKLKTEVVARLDTSSENGLAKLLTDSGRAFLPWEDVEAYARLDPANARLRSLLEWMERGEAWKLLWLPPALPYYAESGPWKAAREQQLSKRLIFSTWTVVPKAVASMVSYDVERRIFGRFDDSIRNTPEERRKRRPCFASRTRTRGLRACPCSESSTRVRAWWSWATPSRYRRARRLWLTRLAAPERDSNRCWTDSRSRISTPSARTRVGTGRPRSSSISRGTASRRRNGSVAGTFRGSGTERRRMKTRAPGGWTTSRKRRSSLTQGSTQPFADRWTSGDPPRISRRLLPGEP